MPRDIDLDRNTAAGAALLLVAFVVVAYLPSFAVPFLFDDYHNIVFNPLAQPDGPGELFSRLQWGSPLDRPVAMLTFGIDYLVAGLDPRWYHGVNLVIHATNAVLLFALVLLLARAPGSTAALQRRALLFAFAVALIWAVHPVNTQAVTYIVQRMASLAALFYLAGLLVFVCWRLGRLHPRLALPLFLLFGLAGFATKPNAATLPLAALLLDVVFFAGFRRVHAWLLGGIAAGAVVLLFVLAGTHAEQFLQAPPHRDFSGLERLLTQGRVICHYLTLLFWPAADRLQVDYDFVVSRGLLDPPATLAAIAFLGALTALAFAGIRRAPWPACGWLFFLLALSIESSFILLELAFEHRLYLPATLLIAGLLAPLFALPWPPGKQHHVRLLLLLLAGLLCWQTILRNQQWQDQGGLWAADLERGASVYRAALNSAVAHLRAGEADRALAMLQHIEDAGAADNRRKRAKLAQSIGEAHFLRGDFEQALAAYRRARELEALWHRPLFYSGLALVQLDRLDEADAMLKRLQQHPVGDAYSVVLEAELLQASGRSQQAFAVVHDRLEAPGKLRAVDRSFLYLQLGNMLREQGDLDAAESRYRTALAEDPGNRAAHNGLQWIARHRREAPEQ